MIEMIGIQAIWLVREGDEAVVRFQAPNGQWREAIREKVDGNFSHICEAAGLRNAIKVQP